MATPLLTTAYVDNIILLAKNRIAALTNEADDKIRQGEPYDRIFNIILLLRAGIRSLSNYNTLTDLQKQAIISCMIKKGTLNQVAANNISPRTVTYINNQTQTTVEAVLNDAGVEDVPQAIVDVTLDPSITTRFNYLVKLKQTFITWLITRLLPSGGVTGQVLSKSSDDDYAVDWETIDDFVSTSTSSNSIGTGLKTFLISDANVFYYKGLRLRISFDETNFIEGIITSFIATTLVLNANISVGSGTHSSWTLNLPGYSGYKIFVSSTKTIAYGSLTWTAINQYGAFGFSKGTKIRGTDTTDSTKWVEGSVTSYNGVDLTINVSRISGSGSITSWEINIGGGNEDVYKTTSTSNIAIGTGSKSFTVSSGLAYQPGTRARAADQANGDNYMEGNVQTYSGTNLVIDVDTIKGSGTIASWYINVGGRVGGHHSYDAYSEISGMPVGLRKAGMYAILNSSLNDLTSIDVTPNTPLFLNMVGNELYVFDSPDNIKIYDTSDTLLATRVVAGATRIRYLAKDDNYVYYSISEGDIGRINIATKTIDAFVYTSVAFVLTAIIVNGKLYATCSTGHVISITIASWGVAAVNISITDPLNLTADVSKNLIYVGSSTTGVVKVIDGATDTVTASITMPGANNSSNNEVSPQTNTVLIIGRTTNELYLIDTNSNTITHTIPTGLNPAVYLIVNGYVYVANFTGNSITKISLFDYSVVATIPVSAGPCGAGVMIYYKGVIFVPCFTAATIDVVNIISNTVSFSKSAVGSTRQLAFNAGTMKLYNSVQSGESVSVFMFQPRVYYILQGDLTSWEEATPLTTLGGLSDGVLEYVNDNSGAFELNDRLIPDVGFTRTLISDAVASVAQPPWSVPILAANWANKSTTNPVGYYLNTIGEVRIKGLLRYTGAVASNISIFILPSGYRPEWDMIFPVYWSGAAEVITSFPSNNMMTVKVVAASGAVLLLDCFQSTFADIDLSSISFRAL